MNIVIFSGTTEGRRLSRALAERGASVTVCVATEYGKEEQGETEGIRVLCGRLTAEQMQEVVRGAELCIDATHPYAVIVTENIRTACEQTGTEYRRLLRPKSEIDNQAVFVDSAEQAAEWLSEREGNVLLTTGAKELSKYAGLDTKRLFPRVLPLHSSLDACEAAGIPHRNIIAVQGPFSEEMNRAMLKQYGIRFLVTKDGGTIGGFTEKLRAAEACGVTAVVIRRPDESGADFETILRSVEEELSCQLR